MCGTPSERRNSIVCIRSFTQLNLRQSLSSLSRAFESGGRVVLMDLKRDLCTISLRSERGAGSLSARCSPESTLRFIIQMFIRRVWLFLQYRTKRVAACAPRPGTISLKGNKRAIMTNGRYLITCLVQSRNSCLRCSNAVQTETGKSRALSFTCKSMVMYPFVTERDISRRV